MHDRLQNFLNTELEYGNKASPVIKLSSPILDFKQVELWIKRDDLIHSVISGNKWRKLKYVLNHALNNRVDTIISMGGTYSNHLHALAFAGKQLELKTSAFIRGEKPAIFTPTLRDISDFGMELNFISRSEYRELRQYKQNDQLPGILQGEYWLPEGGATEFALQGVAEIVSELHSQLLFDSICVPCGTATTLAGLVSAEVSCSHIYGFSALKNAAFLNQDVNNFFVEGYQLPDNWSIEPDYHFGGFAKQNDQLLLFMEEFEQTYGIELDKVYTGKMMYGVFDLIQRDFFKKGERVVVIHTGGLQGNRTKNSDFIG